MTTDKKNLCTIMFCNVAEIRVRRRFRPTDDDTAISLVQISRFSCLRLAASPPEPMRGTPIGKRPSMMR